MTDRSPDPTVDRLLRHMAWANAQLIARLAEQSDDALSLTAPNNEWSAGRILAHLVNAAGGYAARLEGVPRPPDMASLAWAAELAAAADRLAGFDARLRAQATEPDIRLPHADPARPFVPARRSSPRRSTTRPSTAPRSPALSPRTATTRSTSTRSTCGSTAMPRAWTPDRGPFATAADHPGKRRCLPASH